MVLFSDNAGELPHYSTVQCISRWRGTAIVQLWYNCCPGSWAGDLFPFTHRQRHIHTHTHKHTTANHSLVQVARPWDYWWLSLPGGLEAGIWQTQIKGCLELPGASNSINPPNSYLPTPHLFPTITSTLFISLSFGLFCCHGYTQPELSCLGGTCQGAVLRSPDAGRLHWRPLSHSVIVQFGFD